MCLAVPGKVLSITDATSLMRLGKVSFGGIVKEVSLAYVPEAQVGDYVIVHVGFAISRLDEQEAARVFAYLQQLDEESDIRMKFVDEYRNARAAERYARALARIATHPWTIMEVCGGQTHAIVKFGVDALLPRHVTLVHGPGCPVCVTPVELIDKALELAARPEVILCSFGDMLRVPGTTSDLLLVKARGGHVRMVYSPLDALALARQHPDKQVVFFAVGFETTAPANAMAVYQAHREGLTNFSLLVAHVLVPPAMEAILAAPENRVQGFLAAGHVCAVMGYTAYEPLARRYRVPIVVTGFEPLDILQGVVYVPPATGSWPGRSRKSVHPRRAAPGQSGRAAPAPGSVSDGATPVARHG